MAKNANAEGRADRLIGVAGVLMVLCCLAGPAILGVVAGAAIGDGLGLAAALVIACVGVVALWRRWAGTETRC